MSTAVDQLTTMRLQIEQAFNEDDLERANALTDQLFNQLQQLAAEGSNEDKAQLAASAADWQGWVMQSLQTFQRKKREIQGELATRNQSKKAVSAYEAAF